MKKRVLVVVAHPDDETIWMGGTLLKNLNNWNLTILSLCRKYDKDRAPKFKKVCKILKAKCFMLNLEVAKRTNFYERNLHHHWLGKPRSRIPRNSSQHRLHAC